MRRSMKSLFAARWDNDSAVGNRKLASDTIGSTAMPRSAARSIDSTTCSEANTALSQMRHTHFAPTGKGSSSYNMSGMDCGASCITEKRSLCKISAAQELSKFAMFATMKFTNSWPTGWGTVIRLVIVLADGLSRDSMSRSPPLTCDSEAGCGDSRWTSHVTKSLIVFAPTVLWMQISGRLSNHKMQFVRPETSMPFCTSSSESANSDPYCTMLASSGTTQSGNMIFTVGTLLSFAELISPMHHGRLKISFEQATTKVSVSKRTI
mmetsp:Transcript_90458/g.260759  ORF Transcript_90458/g.260759 Transcript_90458/m.260759 type:complete len:265 (-) Transcript_90458:900-1694(-)